MSANLWNQVLQRLHGELHEEDFRRWFAGTVYASDSGDIVTVWVPSESIRRHLQTHFGDHIARTLASLDRSDTEVRFVVAGYDEGEDE